MGSRDILNGDADRLVESDLLGCGSSRFCAGENLADFRLYMIRRDRLLGQELAGRRRIRP